MYQYLHRFDEQLSAVVRMLPSGIEPFMRFVTFIGQPLLLYSLALPIAVWAWTQQRTSISYAVGFAVIAQVGNAALKTLFHRKRPDTIYVDAMLIKSYSFPSGHAFGAAVFVGLLAYLSYRYGTEPWNIVLAVILSLFVLCIGVSRVYLGAHFPSDVLIGWLLGFMSLVVIIRVFQP